MTLRRRCVNRDDGQCPLEVRDRSNYCPLHGPNGLAGSLNHIEIDNRKLRQRVVRLELILGLLIAVLAAHAALNFVATL